MPYEAGLIDCMPFETAGTAWAGHGGEGSSAKLDSRLAAFLRAGVAVLGFRCMSRKGQEASGMDVQMRLLVVAIEDYSAVK
jgi:hypothetical protein